jgi:hypothetical protein
MQQLGQMTLSSRAQISSGLSCVGAIILDEVSWRIAERTRSAMQPDE